MAKVSICIPTYNNVEALKRCLDSVVIQSFKDYEVIVSDDSTNTDIEDILKDAYSDLPIKYSRNEQSLGSPANWNQAIRLAKGDYIHLMHHDDWYANEDSLLKLCDALDANPESDLVFSDYSMQSSENDVEYSFARINTFELAKIRRNPDNLGLRNVIGPPSVCLFRRKRNISFDENLEWVVDLDFYIRLLRMNRNIIYIPECLIYIGMSKTQITYKYLKSKELRKREDRIMYSKLKLKYSCDYYIYHFVKYRLFPQLKNILKHE